MEVTSSFIDSCCFLLAGLSQDYLNLDFKRWLKGSSEAPAYLSLSPTFLTADLESNLAVNRAIFSLMRAASALLLYIMAILCRFKLKSWIILFSISLAGLNYFVEISTAMSRE